MTKKFLTALNLIAAVGRNGQLGLNGELPWGNSEDFAIRNRAAADMRFFKQATTNSIILVGYKTYVELAKKYNYAYWERTT